MPGGCHGSGHIKSRGSGMNRNQAIALAAAAANLVLILSFPPFDTYSLGKGQMPVFGGFYFYPRRTDAMVVNTSLLFLELFVVLINTAIAALLLHIRQPRVTSRGISLQNATLVIVAVNLVVILL